MLHKRNHLLISYSSLNLKTNKPTAATSNNRPAIPCFTIFKWWFQRSYVSDKPTIPLHYSVRLVSDVCNCYEPLSCRIKVLMCASDLRVCAFQESAEHVKFVSITPRRRVTLNTALVYGILVNRWFIGLILALMVVQTSHPVWEEHYKDFYFPCGSWA